MFSFRKFFVAACVFAALVSNAASASTASPGQIIGLTTERTGMLFFQQTGTRSGRPACSIADRWLINASTSAGQAMVALLLTAAAQGKQINVFGTGDCNEWGDTETVEYFTVS